MARTTRQILINIAADAGIEREDLATWIAEARTECARAAAAVFRITPRAAEAWLATEAGARAMARIPAEAVLEVMTDSRENLTQAFREGA